MTETSQQLHVLGCAYAMGGVGLGSVCCTCAGAVIVDPTSNVSFEPWAPPAGLLRALFPMSSALFRLLLSIHTYMYVYM